MRSLYGTRSIIPNNYYFTFDKIYKVNPETIDDDVLIGRAVLYENDSSVYVKTVQGYKKVAVLDNTGRLLRNEGYVLHPDLGDVDINELSGDTYTYNGDGLYIVNFNDLYSENNYRQAQSYNSNESYYYLDKQSGNYKQCICANNYTENTYKNLYYCSQTDNGIFTYSPLFTITTFATSEIFNDLTGPLYELENISGYQFQKEKAATSNNSIYTTLSIYNQFECYTPITIENEEGFKNIIASGKALYYKNSNSELEGITLTNTCYKYDKEQGKFYIEAIDGTKPKLTSIGDLNVSNKFSEINSGTFYINLTQCTSDNSYSAEEVYYEKIILFNFSNSNIIVNEDKNIIIKPISTSNSESQATSFELTGDYYYPIVKTDTAETTTTNYRIVNKQTFDSNELFLLNTSDKNPLENWPSIRGIPKEHYLKDSVFLLEQRSNSAVQDKSNTMFNVTQQSVTETMQGLYVYTTNSTNTNNEIISEFLNTPVEWHLATSGQRSVGQKAIFDVEVYQILTDISYLKDYDINKKILKKDSDTDREYLNHLNKTFIRKGIKHFYLTNWLNEYNNNNNNNKTIDIPNKNQYAYDESVKAFLAVSGQKQENSSENLYNACTVWGEWEDITEQYTGYIGDLDPNTVGFMSPVDTKSQEEYVPAQLPYNKHTQYYITEDQKEYKSANIDQVTFDNSCTDGISSTYYVKANANRGNLNNSNTLVEATNTLDEIIGSKTRLYGKQVNQITQGSLSKDLADDLRPYNIPEDDIMDTLVHHDADIGAIENLSNEKDTYNLTFTKQNEQPDNINSSNNNTVNVRSLTDSTIKTDNMIGYINRLGIKSTVNGNGHDVKGITGTGNTKEDNIENNQIFSDARPYNIPETNIIDTLVHHDADIGAIEDLKARQGSDNNTNNLNFTTAKDPTDTDQLKGVNDIQSIKDALIILDNLIGARRRLSDTTLATNDTTLINSNADSNDKRPVNIPENNIIDSIIHHDADIGEIEKLNTTHTSERTMNNNNLIYSSSATNQKIRKEDNEWKVAEIRSLTDAIEALDKIIGPIIGFNGKTVSGMLKDLDATIDFPYDLNDTRSINIPDHNIIYAIGHHDADIGAIENLKAGQKEKNNTNNLNFVNSGNSSNLDNENNQISNINSLTEAIIKLDNMIGYLGRLNANNENGDYVNTNNGTQGITGTGNNGDTRPYSIPETTVIDTLVHHDADIGFIEELNGNNIEFTQKEKDENNKHEINSLTDAITILDNIIGNYDDIENEDNSNLKGKNTDLVTAINHLSKSIVGYKSELNSDETTTNLKTETLVAAINALDNILGKFELKENLNASKEETFISAIQKLDEVLGNFELIQNSNTPNATTFIDAIKGLDTILGKFDKVGTNNLNLENITTFIDAIKQLDKIIGNASGLAANENIISAINNIKTTLEELHVNDIMEYIRNLAENVDVLDVTIHNMMNEQSLMEWGTF